MQRTYIDFEDNIEETCFDKIFRIEINPEHLSENNQKKLDKTKVIIIKVDGSGKDVTTTFGQFKEMLIYMQALEQYLKRKNTKQESPNKTVTTNLAPILGVKKTTKRHVKFKL